jgi:hypothetical protein
LQFGVRAVVRVPCAAEDLVDPGLIGPEREKPACAAHTSHYGGVGVVLGSR